MGRITKFIAIDWDFAVFLARKIARVYLAALLLCSAFVLGQDVQELREELEWPELESWQVNERGRLEYQPPQEVGAPTFQKHWLEKSREGVANGWKYFNDIVDSYVSNDDRELVNDSYMRLRLGNTFFRSDSRFTIDLKVKADLARTENQLGLWADNTLNFFLDTNPEDQKSLQQQSLDRTFGKQGRENGATAGFRLEFAEKKHWKTDFDLGLKSGAPIDPFTRLTFKRRYQITNKWGATWRHRFYAYYHRDSGYQTDFKVYRKISSKWHYFNTTEVKWNHDDKHLGYANISAFSQTISSRSFAVWSFGGFYEDYPGSYLSSHFFEVSYTRRLYQDWFFLQLVPRLDYFHINDFGSTPSFLLRFDILFSN